MKSMFKIILSSVGMITTPAILMAHPGHGHENPLSPGHYVANPEHFIPLALTVGATLLAVYAYRTYWSKSRQKK